MARIDTRYNPLLEAILERGYLYETENRPDVVMRQITSANMEIEMDEFPAITTKKLYWKGVVAELLWFLKGDDNIKYLNDNGVHIWDKDAHAYANRRGGNVSSTDVGRNYGVQWRDWTGGFNFDFNDYEQVDQITELITNLRKPNPISRRHIVTAWNPAELHETALPPCHWSFEVLPRPLTYSGKIQIMVSHGGDKEYLEALWKAGISGKDEQAKKTLDKEVASIPDYGFTLKWHQRSVDTFLGLPFNIASYGLLAEIIGYLTGMAPLSLIGDLSNVHIYGPHTDAVKKQLNNSVLAHKGCKLVPSRRFIDDVQTYRQDGMDLNDLINNLQIDDFSLDGYTSFGTISADMIAPTNEES